MTSDPSLSTVRPLNVTKQGNHRVFVGLSWDPNQGKSFTDRLKNVVTGKKNYHDLDLSCFLYDKNHVFIDVISGKIGQIADQSGAIYHSGDDQEGIGGGDDEQISVELKTCLIIFITSFSKPLSIRGINSVKSNHRKFA